MPLSMLLEYNIPNKICHSCQAFLIQSARELWRIPCFMNGVGMAKRRVKFVGRGAGFARR